MENTNLSLTLEAWAEIVVQKWEDKIARLGISFSGDLVTSFACHVQTEAGGNAQKIQFAFEYYGKFVDMGVGKGVKIDQVSASRRRPKKWYSPTFFSQIKKLSEILQEKYAQQGALSIIENVQDNSIKK